MDTSAQKPGLSASIAATIAVCALVFIGVPPKSQPAFATVSLAAPTLKWLKGGCLGSYCQTGWYASPVVTDLEDDGAPDVVWGSYDVVALDGATGSLKWRAASTQRVWPGLALTDLTGDGTREIVVGRSNNQLTVYNAAGGVVLGWPKSPFASGTEVRSLAISDLDNDGTQEIVVGRAGSGATQQVNVYEPDGTVRPGWPARHGSDPGYGWGMYNENVAVGDVDEDGFPDVVGPTDTHYITVLARNGSQLAANAIYGAGKVWSQVGVHVDHAVDLRGYANCGTEHRPNFAASAPAIADVNGDGVSEIVVVGNVYNCAASPYQSLHLLPWILKGDRTRWVGNGFDWTAIPAAPAASGPLSEDYDVIENIAVNTVVGDLDGDGLQEVLFPWYNGRLHAYWLDKTQHGSWPYVVPGGGMRFASEPSLADLDNDGQTEVIFTSWPAKSGSPVGKLHILSSMGQPLHEIDLPGSFPAGSYNGGLAAPTIANIDQDEDYEIVVGTVSAGVVAYDLPGTSRARILWGTGRGGPHRAGIAEPGDVIFRDAFESGDATGWDQLAGTAAVSAGAPLHGAYTLTVTASDTTGGLVQDDSPGDESRYRARFMLATDTFDPGEAQGHLRARLFYINGGAPARRLAAVVIRRQAGAYSLIPRVRLDDNSIPSATPIALADGTHAVQIDWKRATGPGRNNGWFKLWVDGTLQTTMSGLDNDQRGADDARLGLLGVKTGSSGSMRFDRFESRRDTYIP